MPDGTNRRHPLLRHHPRSAPVLALSAILLVPALSSWSQPDISNLRSQEEMQWGIRAFHAGSFNNAILSLERAISLDGSNFRARRWLGRTLYHSGLEDDALREWAFVTAKGEGGAQLASMVDTIKARRSLDSVLGSPETYSLVSEVGSSGARDPRIGKPSSVRARGDGTFYVVPYTGTQLLRLDSNFRVVQVIRGGLEGFNRPFDVLEADDGSLFVSEFGADRVAKCSPSGQKVALVGGTGTAPGRLLGPQYLAADGKGYFYVSEHGNRRVSKFDLDGNFILTIGTRTADFAGLQDPTGLAVADGRLYVADRRAGVLRVFDLTGNYLGSVGHFDQPEGVQVLGAGRLLIAQKGSLLMFDTRTETTRSLADPAPRIGRVLGLTVDANGDVLAADFDAGKVLFFARTQTLYAGLFVQVERVTADRFPEVVVDLSVTERSGRPIYGLKSANFTVSESYRPVGNLQLALDASAARPLYVMLLAEKSPAMQAGAADLGSAVEEVVGGMEGSASVGLAVADAAPSLVVPEGGHLLGLREAVLSDDYSDRWRFDEGVHVAASQLITSRARRALVYLSTGALGSSPYSQYPLMELAQLMRNNQVSFHVLHIGSAPLNPDLRYLAEQTGGSVTELDGPRRVRPLVDAVKAWVPPLYTLRYTSARDSDFGRVYIPLEVSVTQQRRTGRDESGYYGPRQF